MINRIYILLPSVLSNIRIDVKLNYLSVDDMSNFSDVYSATALLANLEKIINILNSYCKR